MAYAIPFFSPHEARETLPESAGQRHDGARRRALSNLWQLYCTQCCKKDRHFTTFADTYVLQKESVNQKLLLREKENLSIEGLEAHLAHRLR